MHDALFAIAFSMSLLFSFSVGMIVAFEVMERKKRDALNKCVTLLNSVFNKAPAQEKDETVYVAKEFNE